MNSPEVIIRRNKRMKPLNSNKSVIHGNEEQNRRIPSPVKKALKVEKTRIENIKELISLMFNDNKSALSKLQKTINMVLWYNI